MYLLINSQDYIIYSPYQKICGNSASLPIDRSIDFREILLFFSPQTPTIAVTVSPQTPTIAVTVSSNPHHCRHGHVRRQLGVAQTLANSAKLDHIMHKDITS